MLGAGCSRKSELVSACDVDCSWNSKHQSEGYGCCRWRTRWDAGIDSTQSSSETLIPSRPSSNYSGLWPTRGHGLTMSDPCRHEKYRGSSQIRLRDGDPESARPWKTTNQASMSLLQIRMLVDLRAKSICKLIIMDFQNQCQNCWHCKR